MIINEQTLKDELEILNSAVTSAITLFESRIDESVKVALYSVVAGQDEIIPEAKIWVVNSSAKITTDTIDIVISV